MNQIFKTFLICALALVVVAACEQKQTESTSSAAPSASPTTAQQYTCTMHPEVVQDGPGNCPKCGMALVPKTTS